MAFGFQTPNIHDVHAVTAILKTNPGWTFAAIELTFTDAEGNEDRIDIFLPKDRQDYALSLCNAIDAISPRKDDADAEAA